MDKIIDRPGFPEKRPVDRCVARKKDLFLPSSKTNVGKDEEWWGTRKARRYPARPSRWAFPAGRPETGPAFRRLFSADRKDRAGAAKATVSSEPRSLISPRSRSGCGRETGARRYGPDGHG